MIKISSHAILFNKRNNKKFSCHSRYSVDKRIVFQSKKYNLNLIYKKLLENIKEIYFSTLIVIICFSFYFVFLLCNYIYIYTFAISICSCIVGYFRHLDTFTCNKILSEARPILPDFCRAKVREFRNFTNPHIPKLKSHFTKVCYRHILV